MSNPTFPRIPTKAPGVLHIRRNIPLLTAPGAPGPASSLTSGGGKHFTLAASVCASTPAEFFTVTTQFAQVNTGCPSTNEDPTCAINYCLSYCDTAVPGAGFPANSACVQMLIQRLPDQFWECGVEYTTDYTTNTGFAAYPGK